MGRENDVFSFSPTAFRSLRRSRFDVNAEFQNGRDDTLVRSDHFDVVTSQAADIGLPYDLARFGIYCHPRRPAFERALP